MNIIEKTILKMADNLEAKRDAKIKDFCWNNCIVAEDNKHTMASCYTFSQVAARFGVSRQKVVSTVFIVARQLDEIGRDDAAAEAKRDAADVQGAIKASMSTGSPLADAVIAAGLPVKVVDI